VLLGITVLMVVLATELTPMSPLWAFVGGIAFATFCTRD